MTDLRSLDGPLAYPASLNAATATNVLNSPTIPSTHRPAPPFRVTSSTESVIGNSSPSDGPTSRRQTLSAALAGMDATKRSCFGVVFLKGGLAVGQVTLLVVLLVLSRQQRATPRLDKPEETCRSAHLFEVWMTASAVRLSVCWAVSLWVLARKGRRQQDQAGDQIEVDDSADDNVVHEAAGASRRQSASDTVATNASSLDDDRDDKHLPADQRNILRSLCLALDWLAPKFSALLLATSAALFVWGNTLVWSSVSTCKRSEPLLWWGVTTIVGVGWFLLAEVAVVVLGVGLLGPSVLAALRWMKILPPAAAPMTPLPAPAGPISQQDVLALTRLVCYVPNDSNEKGSSDSGEKRSLEAAVAQTMVKRRIDPLPRFNIFGRRKTRSHTALSASSSIASLPVLLSAGKDLDLEPELALAQPKSGHLLVSEDPDDAGHFAHPVIRLPPHSACCTICLADFQPARPRNISAADKVAVSDVSTDETKDGNVRDTARAAGTDDDPIETSLRLLPCGHVFHDRCIVPWLTESSGRCPLCNRALEIPTATSVSV